MKLTKKDVVQIRSMAIDNYTNQNCKLYWSNTEEVEDNRKMAIAHIEAISAYLQLNIEIDYKKEKF